METLGIIRSLRRKTSYAFTAVALKETAVSCVVDLENAQVWISMSIIYEYRQSLLYSVMRVGYENITLA